MVFNTTTDISNILFKGWDTHTWKGVLESTVIICALTIIFEGLKTAKSYVTIRRRKRPLVSGNEVDSHDSGIEITSMHAELITSPSSSSIQLIHRRKFMLFSLESLLHMLNFFFGYVLMFLVMTYSVWFLLAILLGSGAGFFIFQPIIAQLTSKYYAPKTKSTHHMSDAAGASHDESFSINTPKINEGLIL